MPVGVDEVVSPGRVVVLDVDLSRWFDVRRGRTKQRTTHVPVWCVHEVAGEDDRVEVTGEPQVFDASLDPFGRGVDVPEHRG